MSGEFIVRGFYELVREGSMVGYHGSRQWFYSCQSFGCGCSVMGMGLVSVVSLLALWNSSCWCRPSDFWFEALGVLLEAGNAIRGAQEGSDDYDQLEFCTWK